MRPLPSAILSVLAAVAAPGAQEFLVEPRLSLGSDFQAGVRAGAGAVLPGGSLVAAFLDAEARPVAYPVRVRESETFSYQYREIRGTLGPGTLWAHPLGKDFSLEASAGVAYTLGDYWGSNRDPASGFVGWGGAGFRYTLDESAHCGLSYQYRPLPGISPHRLLLQYGWRFK